MRAVTIAAAGAAILSSVSATSHVENMNKHLNPRWDDWSSVSGVADATKPADSTKATPTYTKPVEGDEDEDDESSTTEHTWLDWTTTSGDPVKDVTKTTTTTTTSDPVKITSKTTTSHTWEDWTTTTTSSDPVEITSTTYEHTWEDWTSTTSSDPVEITSTTSADPSHTWADWETSSDPVEITSTTSADPSHTWADWESESSPIEITSTIVKSGTTTTTIYLGKPTDPADPSHTWEDWTSTASDPSESTVTSYDPTTTTIWGDWAASSSSPAPAWSSDGWFGPGWSGADGQCAFQVVTSYGSPVWAATPDASIPVIEVTVSPTAPAEETATYDPSHTWEDWSSTTSTPTEETSTTSYDPSHTWADWTTTSSTPSEETTTTTSYDPSHTWADWTTSSTPSEETTTTTTSYDPSHTWADWTTSASATPTSGSDDDGSLGGDGKNTWGLTYSPYTSEGGCKDAETVAADLSVIAGKGFSTVRVYSTDCDTLENVGKSARDLDLKLILGVFISNTGIEASKKQLWDIIKWAQWDLVELIVIGNEAIFNGYTSAEELAGYITESAGYLEKFGYTGPVTTTEPLAEWKKDGAELCDVVDVVAANLYAFFNAEVTPDKAGDFIQRQIKELEAVCPGKETYVMESGWPSEGACNGAACPSKENQVTAIHSIQAVTGSKVIFFSYENEAWKEPGEFGVEQFWGCADAF